MFITHLRLPLTVALFTRGASVSFVLCLDHQELAPGGQKDHRLGTFFIHNEADLCLLSINILLSCILLTEAAQHCFSELVQSWQ